jgi:hypothetical protein
LVGVPHRSAYRAKPLWAIRCCFDFYCSFERFGRDLSDLSGSLLTSRRRPVPPPPPPPSSLPARLAADSPAAALSEAHDSEVLAQVPGAYGGLGKAF